MAQITATEIKGYIADQLQGYDKNVAQVKLSASAKKKQDDEGNVTGFELYQGVNSDKTPKKIFDVDFPQGGGGSVDFETKDIDFDSEW